MFIIFILLFFGCSSALDTVLIPPPVVTAGVPAAVQFRINASTCSLDFDSERGCDWEYFIPWLIADPDYNPKDIYVVQPQCFLAPCVTTNLTSFEITIPPSAVPNSGPPYMLSYLFFNFRSDGSVDTYEPIWATFASDRFNITGANASWTPYDLRSRYYSDNSARAWFNNVSCDALECARNCANKYVAPKPPYTSGSIPEVDACVEACPGYGWDPTNCINQNAASPSSTGDATPSLSTTGSTPTSSTPFSTPFSTGLATRTSKGISSWLAPLMLIGVAYI